MMKKLSAVFFALALLVTVAACGSNVGESNYFTSSPSTTTGDGTDTGTGSDTATDAGTDTGTTDSCLAEHPDAIWTTSYCAETNGNSGARNLVFTEQTFADAPASLKGKIEFTVTGFGDANARSGDFWLWMQAKDVRGIKALLVAYTFRQPEEFRISYQNNVDQRSGFTEVRAGGGYDFDPAQTYRFLFEWDGTQTDPTATCTVYVGTDVVAVRSVAMGQLLGTYDHVKIGRAINGSNLGGGQDVRYTAARVSLY